MAALAKFRQLVEDHQDSVDFLTVYIAEAHASDGWAVPGAERSIASHRNLDDRLLAASILQDELGPCPMAVDTMADECSVAYGALPERFYIILDGIVKYAGEKGPSGYHVSEVRDWIEKYN